MKDVLSEFHDIELYVWNYTDSNEVRLFELNIYNEAMLSSRTDMLFSRIFLLTKKMRSHLVYRARRLCKKETRSKLFRRHEQLAVG